MTNQKITELTAITTPLDPDLVEIVDMAATPTNKKLTWANIKATLKTYFDTLYDSLGAASTVQGNLDTHEADTDNPHSVTKAQVGLTDVTDDVQVKVADTQSITGEKTFDIFPITPSAAPDADYEVANKKYVDDNGGGGESPLNSPVFVRDETQAQLFRGFCIDKDGDGDIYFSEYYSSRIRIYRFTRAGSGLLSKSGSTSVRYWFNNNSYKISESLTIIGDYMYLWVQKVSDSSYLVLRIKLSDGTTSEMTISGTAPADGTNYMVFNDDTNLYIWESGATVRKYTISGTTLTYVSVATMPRNRKGSRDITTDGVHIWYVGASEIFTKAEMDGTEIEAHKMIEDNSSNDYYRGFCRDNSYVYGFGHMYWSSEHHSPFIYPVEKL